MDLLLEWRALLDAFFAAPAGMAVKALVVGALLTFALGVMAALRDGTFDWRYVDAFVRSAIWGKVAPVLAVLLIGYLLDSPEAITVGIVVAGTVAAGMLRAALDSIQQMMMPKADSATVNTLPGDAPGSLGS